MATISIDIVAGADIAEKVRLAGDAARARVADATEITGYAVRNRWIEGVRVFQGNYRTHIPPPSRAGLTVRVYTDVAYAAYEEFGTRPHWPPDAPLRRWVQLKLRPPARELSGVTYLVRRKIARYGTKGSFALTRAVQGETAGFISRVTRALQGDA